MTSFEAAADMSEAEQKSSITVKGMRGSRGTRRVRGQAPRPRAGCEVREACGLLLWGVGESVMAVRMRTSESKRSAEK